MAAPGAITDECRICLGPGRHSAAPSAASGTPAAGAPQQLRPPSVRPAGAAAAAGAPPAAHAGDDPGPAEQLIAPCKCQGSVRYVHKECLLVWLRSQAGKESVPKCCVCKAEYHVVAQKYGLFTSPGAVFIACRMFYKVAMLLVAATLTTSWIIRAGGGPVGVGHAAWCLQVITLWKALTCLRSSYVEALSDQPYEVFRERAASLVFPTSMLFYLMIISCCVVGICSEAAVGPEPREVLKIREATGNVLSGALFFEQDEFGALLIWFGAALFNFYRTRHAGFYQALAQYYICKALMSMVAAVALDLQMTPELLGFTVIVVVGHAAVLTVHNQVHPSLGPILDVLEPPAQPAA
eukprot:TRINITY_DN27059_c0_g1_i1.p1 TRINITY_DN27059_c0_g1~~TRINITY_DN27059_c0_g1_i1.p1  ORF type:complete len:378 (+),score=56.50 TRINITY_DN27059_c0_g1_i1:80-1135(+)